MVIKQIIILHFYCKHCWYFMVVLSLGNLWECFETFRNIGKISAQPHTFIMHAD